MESKARVNVLSATLKKTGEGKKGPWSIYEVLCKTDGEYPKYYNCSCFDKETIEKFEKGLFDEAMITCRFESKEWSKDGRSGYFNNITIIEFEPLNLKEVSSKQSVNTNASNGDPFDSDDDLPF